MHRIRIVTSREGSRRFRILDPASWLPPVFPSKRGMPDHPQGRFMGKHENRNPIRFHPPRRSAPQVDITISTAQFGAHLEPDG